MPMDIALPSQSADIPWNPRTGRQVDAGGLWTQVSAITPVALSASTCPGKHAELQPDSEHLNGFPGFHLILYLEFLGDPNRFTGYQPRIARLVQFLVSEGCRDPCVFC